MRAVTAMDLQVPPEEAVDAREKQEKYYDMMGQAGKGEGMFCNKMCVYDTVMNVSYDKINFNSKIVSRATRLMTSYIVAGFVFAIKFYYIVQLHSSFLVWRGCV